ncbi:DUF4145 domain-containing protein [Vibrio crassostreae]|uniref:DUF4145 domain-containing protein n=1 Tax=Vibrio crassostreae TaxID=246167 RepID=UPI001B3053D2|nr:DUF4145 domain-containing protein [Vibrio crassostreae]
MKSTIWLGLSDKSAMTDFTCPFCNKGLLKLFRSNLILKEYEYSKKNHTHQDMESDWVESSCSGVFQCNHDNCLEYVSFCGDARGDDVEYDCEEIPGGWGVAYVDKVKVKFVHPSPHIIHLNDKYPPSVLSSLQESFSLYWSSPKSCANKLRVVIEEILNDLKIPSEHDYKDRRNGKVKKCSSTTHHRIEQLGKIDKYREASDFLLGIKVVGNTASHASSFKENAILDTYKLLDKTLELIYSGKDEELNRLKELAKSKKLA